MSPQPDGSAVSVPEQRTSDAEPSPVSGPAPGPVPGGPAPDPAPGAAVRCVGITYRFGEHTAGLAR